MSATNTHAPVVLEPASQEFVRARKEQGHERGKPTVVIGYEATDLGCDAVSLGRLLAETRSARVVLATFCVAEGTSTDAAAEDALEGAAVELAERAGIRTIEISADERGVGLADDLHRLAEEEGADVLVLAATHRHPLLGGLSETLADKELHVPGPPLAIAPRGFHERKPRSFRTVGVAYDGSPEAERAVEYALQTVTAQGPRDRAKPITVLGPTLRLLSVAQPPLMHLGAAAVIAASYHSRLERGQSAVLDALAGERVRAESRLLVGDPETVLRRETKELDLIVVGSRGHGPLQRILLGGVSSALIRGAYCPVIVVPHSLEAPEEDGEQP